MLASFQHLDKNKEPLSEPEITDTVIFLLQNCTVNTSQASVSFGILLF